MLMAAARTINGDKHKIPFFIPDRRMPLRTTMTHAIHWCTTNVNCRAIGRFHEYYELWILINSHPPTPYAYAKHIPNNLHLNGKLKFNIRQKLHTPHVSMHTNKQPLHNHIRCRRIYTIYMRLRVLFKLCQIYASNIYANVLFNIPTINANGWIVGHCWRYDMEEDCREQYTLEA